MKRTLTHSNAFKNLNPNKPQTIKTNQTLKLPVLIVLNICLMMSLNLTQAQSNDCPLGNPLEWDWIQELITNNSCEIGLIKHIDQFEYNGNNYFNVHQSLCNDNISEPNSNTFFDCLGNVVCFSWHSFSDCDQEFSVAARNSTNLWSYEYNCNDPFEIYKIQQAMEDDCTDSIYAFEYEDTPYIYIKKGCNYYDVIYNCKAAYICSEVSNNFARACNTTIINEVQSLLNEDNVIWTNPCAYELTGWVDNSGCGLYIGCCLDSQFEPLILPEGFTLQEGQNVEFSVNGLNTGEWCLPLGIQVEVTCIREVVEDCGCSSSSIYQVCGTDGNTYDNACLATCIGVEVAYSGECIPCNNDDPLQADWMKELIANDEGCTVHEIQQFEYNGKTYFAVLPYMAGAGFDRNGQPCLIDVGTTYYNCIGTAVCYYDGISNTCDAELFEAANSATTVWTYNEAGCSNPLDTDFVQQWINDGCAAEAIYSFEYEGETFIYVEPNTTCDIFYQNYYYSGYNDEWANLYNCNSGLACYPDLGNDYVCYTLGDSFYEDSINDDNLIWTKPCTYELTGEVIQYEDFEYSYGYENCGGLVILMETESYQGEVFNYLLYPEIIPDGFVLQEGQTVELTYRKLHTDTPCNFTENVEIICIREVNQGNQMKCPDNTTTSICAPVTVPPSLNLQDFSTTDDPNYINSLSIEMEEQTEVKKYFNTTTRVYTISDESGNQETCETKHHIASQFLQIPEVSEPGTICEEDLWSYIKIGVDQYKIYADHNGSKGPIMSSCNTPDLICSTADLDVDTKIPKTYNFWASTYFEFPDGSICESEAMPFYADVQAKPVAALTTSNKTIQVGEGIALMNLVTTNKSGYWSGKNIVYLMTATGENIAYFSADNSGAYKLYYTVKNDFCERSYLLVLEVASSEKAALSDQSYKTTKTLFNIYPNPATKNIFIELPDKAIYQISITDISGKLMKQMEAKMDERMIEIDLNGFSKGIYLVELKNDLESNIQKLLIE